MTQLAVIAKNGKSKYNSILLLHAKELASWVLGDTEIVSLTGFKDVGNRKRWKDVAHIVEIENQVLILGTINAPTIAVCNILATYGYRGQVCLSKDVLLTREILIEAPKPKPEPKPEPTYLALPAAPPIEQRWAAQYL